MSNTDEKRENDYTLTCVITEIEETKHISDKLSTRKVKAESVEKYPQKVVFEFCNRNIMKLNGFTEGMQATFKFNISGRNWTNTKGEEKNFLSLRAYSLK